MALVLGLVLSPIVGASGFHPGVASPGGPAAPRPIERDPRAPAAPLPEPFGITTRISERAGGGDAAGASAEASISANGQYVAFSSAAPDLVAGDTNGAQDVFRLDRASGQIIRLPVDGRAPVPPGGRASDPAISPDGGFVAFAYQGPASGATTVFVPSGSLVLLWDASSGFTRIVSIDLNGRPALGSSEPAVSDGGRYVAYTSLNPNLAPGDNNRQTDVFRVDTLVGATTMVSQTPSGTSPRGSSRSPAISADGSIVAFSSNAPNILIPEPPPPSPPPSSPPGIVVFPVGSPVGFVPPPGGGIVAGVAVGVGDDGAAMQAVAPSTEQVYARNITQSSTELISMTPNGIPGSGRSLSPSISSDGNVIAFASFATDLAAGDGDSASDVYVRDRGSRQTSLLTGDVIDAGQVAISGNGQIVVFATTGRSAGGPPGDATLTGPPFTLVETSAGCLPSTLSPSQALTITITTPGVTFAGTPTLSAPGSLGASATAGGAVLRITLSGSDTANVEQLTVSGLSFAGGVPAASVTTVLGGDPKVVACFGSDTEQPQGGGFEVYHRDRFSGETIHISVAVSGGDGGADNVGPVVSAEGRLVAWASTSARLIADDGNGLGDVFVRDLPPAGTIDPPLLDFGTRALGTVAPPGSATLTSVGWSPLGSIAATIVGGDAGDFTLGSDGCTGAVLPRPQSCTLTVLFSPQAVGPRSSTLQVTDNGFGSPHTVRLVGVGSNVELTLDPPMGPPGIVTIATGKGFPPKTKVILTWTVGITQRIAPILTDARGGFRTQVLVFHHDVEGPRDLVVSPADGKAFRPIAVAFFVSTPTNSPPGFDPTRFLSDLPRGWFLR